MEKSMYCNNCGSKGHVFKTCKDPVTSCGILLLRGIFEPLGLPTDPKNISVLMVKRKDSMAYMEFIRGKYDLTDIPFIKRLISNMTKYEQELIMLEDFDTLWTKLWGQGRDTHSVEYELAKKSYTMLDRQGLVLQCPSSYTEPEWGFPKGRRSKGETDVQCAIREFEEETNISKECYKVYDDIVFTEVFTGTNNVKYKHIYFVATLISSKSIKPNQKLTQTQRREVSAVGWKTIKQCRDITRPHYAERKAILTELERVIATYENPEKK